ncbi:hypothetical protein NX059_004992 [Plenodomus lindquistii]|nr:hypothetical protein NX059_004992 [Plenodomus lindquistii]
MASYSYHPPSRRRLLINRITERTYATIGYNALSLLRILRKFVGLDPRYTRDFTPCSTCQSLLVRPAEPACTSTLIIYDHGHIIIASASKHCKICALLLDMLQHLRIQGSYRAGVGLAYHWYSSEPYQIVLQTMCDGLRLPEESFALIPALAYAANIRKYPPAWGLPQLFPVATPIIAERTSDRRCLDLVKKWTSTCLESHTKCKARERVDDSNILPARLISVARSEIRIVSTKNFAPANHTRYMTLSHRWQPQATLELTRHNLAQMGHHIDIYSLPQIFQDAIYVARYIGIPYVWIDALCIVQDDDTNRLQKIFVMGHIYRNAILNVGGTAAADTILNQELIGSDSSAIEPVEWETGSSDLFDSPLESSSAEPSGLLLDRDNRIISPFGVQVRRRDLRQRYYAVPSDLNTALSDSALFRRGWVLQERPLSRRSAYFGQQIYWECSEFIACEAFPHGLPFQSSEEWGLSDPLRISALLWKMGEAGHQYQNPPTGRRLHYLRWTNVVEWYSRCSLTDTSDFFPALSGLAKYFQVVLKDDYIAGMWRKDMLRGLLWRPNVWRQEIWELGEYKVYPTEYQSPSWSCASTTSPIEFTSHHWEMNLRSSTHIVEINEVHIISSDGDPFGKISDGFIRMTGHLRPCVARYSKLSADRIHDFEWYDHGYSAEALRNTAGMHFFAMVIFKDQGPLSFSENGTANPWEVWGLILEPVQGMEKTYRRVGMFGHIWSKHATVCKSWNFVDYPEFEDFDPDHLERQTITVI